mgnify:CR=1 FL=1
MSNSIAIIIVTGLIVISCNQTGKYYPPGGKNTSERGTSKADSLTSSVQSVETVLPENDLQLFCNNEIAPYCVLLPLHEFREDYTDSVAVKAKHKFVLKQDPKSFTRIEVQAFTIDKKNNYNTVLFYKRDKKDEIKQQNENNIQRDGFFHKGC